MSAFLNFKNLAPESICATSEYNITLSVSRGASAEAVRWLELLGKKDEERLDFEEWRVYIKIRNNSESRAMVAHAEPKLWVATVILSPKSVQSLSDFFVQASANLSSVHWSLQESDRIHRTSNLGVWISLV